MHVRVLNIAAAIATVILLSTGALLASSHAPAPFPGAPPVGTSHQERKAYCDSVRAVCLRELSGLYQAGQGDSLRTVAALWQDRCNGYDGMVESAALRLLLAAGDGDLDQQVNSYTLPQMKAWHAPGREAEAEGVAFRSMIAGMATRLSARDDLTPAAEFVARYYAGQDVEFADLRSRRYRGSALRKAALRDHQQAATSETIGFLGCAYSSDFVTGSTLEFVRVAVNPRRTVVYEATMLRLLSVVAEVDHTAPEKDRYRGNLATTCAVTGASWFMADLTTKLLLDPDLPVGLSPLSYFWFAPNSRINRRLGGNLWFSASTNTEFVLVRGAAGERGILFSPRLGIALGDGLPPAEWSSLAISIGPQYWWSFESDSSWRGLAVSIQLESLGN